MIKKILTEWSFRLDDGMINLHNSKHMIVLSEVLKDMDLPEKVIVEVIKNITTKKSDVIFVLDDLNPKKSFIKLSEKYPFLKEKECILIKTKCDDLKNINKKNIIEISCKKNLGIDLLLTTLLTSIRVGIE